MTERDLIFAGWDLWHVAAYPCASWMRAGVRFSMVLCIGMAEIHNQMLAPDKPRTAIFVNGAE
jgi:hypothetical protein